MKIESMSTIIPAKEIKFQFHFSDFNKCPYFYPECTFLQFQEILSSGNVFETFEI